MVLMIRRRLLTKAMTMLEFTFRRGVNQFKSNVELVEPRSFAACWLVACGCESRTITTMMKSLFCALLALANVSAFVPQTVGCLFPIVSGNAEVNVASFLIHYLLLIRHPNDPSR